MMIPGQGNRDGRWRAKYLNDWDAGMRCQRALYSRFYNYTCLCVRHEFLLAKGGEDVAIRVLSQD